MAKKDYESRTEAMLVPIVEAKGFELVDVEWVKEGANWYLRAYIDKPGGIAVDDCEVISRALSDKLDEEDYIEDSSDKSDTKKCGRHKQAIKRDVEGAVPYKF